MDLSLVLIATDGSATAGQSANWRGAGALVGYRVCSEMPQLVSRWGQRICRLAQVRSGDRAGLDEEYGTIKNNSYHLLMTDFVS